MQSEFQVLTENKTWYLVYAPLGRKLIGCKWIFKVKQNLVFSILKYKVRLVAKGFNQVEGFDYSETFSPVVKPATIRLILAIAVSEGWPLRQLDVNNVFLNGVFTEDMYMVQPPGFIHSGQPHLVCKLNKALCGLKQAPRYWFERFKEALWLNKALGFIFSRANHSLFYNHSNGCKTYTLVYVDDIILPGSHQKSVG